MQMKMILLLYENALTTHTEIDRQMRQTWLHIVWGNKMRELIKQYSVGLARSVIRILLKRGVLLVFVRLIVNDRNLLQSFMLLFVDRTDLVVVAQRNSEKKYIQTWSHYILRRKTIICGITFNWHRPFAHIHFWKNKTDHWCKLLVTLYTICSCVPSK